MPERILTRLFEHHNWANLRILDACASLSDEQFDFQPQTAVRGTIREMLDHLVTSQEDYTWMLIRFDHPPDRASRLSLSALRELTIETGRELIAWADSASDELMNSRIDLSDGYRVEPGVIITQVINHATEHREQIKSLLTSLGVEPPRIDGWQFGRHSGALIPPAAA